jgi:Leucine-rich repeat (LRR) protein
LLPEGPIFLAKLSGLRHLSLRNTNLQDSHLGQIAKLPNLGSLVLDHTNVTGKSLSLLASCEKLSIVHLSGNKIDSSSLANELQLYFKVCRRPTLRSLVLADCELTPEDLERIKVKAPFVNLRVTSKKLDAEKVMPSVDQTPQRIREVVAAATFLERAYQIDLVGTKSMDGSIVVDAIGLKGHSEPVADWAMNYVSLMTDVIAIGICDLTLSCEGLSRIQNLNLKYLTLEKGRIGRGGLEAISKFPNLQGLGLKEAEIVESELSTLKELKKLSIIVLDKSNVTDAGLQVLPQFPALEAISAANCDITDTGARCLEKVKLLQRVNLEGCPVSPEVIKELTAKCRENSDTGRSTQE